MKKRYDLKRGKNLYCKDKTGVRLCEDGLKFLKEVEKKMDSIINKYYLDLGYDRYQLETLLTHKISYSFTMASIFDEPAKKGKKEK